MNIGEGRACNGNEDCLEGQYCYHFNAAFKHCVKYITCSTYNRVEAEIPARKPYDCGPCMKGYTNIVEDLELPMCNKEDDYLPAEMDKTNYVIYVTITIIIIALLGIFVIIYKQFDKIRNCNVTRISKRFSCLSVRSEEINQNKSTIVNMNEEAVIPIASAPEQRPFIEKANSNVSSYNDRIAYNKFQTATACHAPTWVQNANYGTNILTYPNDEIASEENHRNLSIQSATVNTIEEISSGPELNEHDNMIIRSLSPSPTYYPNNSANEDNEAGSDANHTSLSSQPSVTGETFPDKIKNYFIRQSLNQKIIMNVNVNE